MKKKAKKTRRKMTSKGAFRAHINRATRKLIKAKRDVIRLKREIAYYKAP